MAQKAKRCSWKLWMLNGFCLKILWFFLLSFLCETEWTWLHENWILIGKMSLTLLLTVLGALGEGWDDSFHERIKRKISKCKELNEKRRWKSRLKGMWLLKLYKCQNRGRKGKFNTTMLLIWEIPVEDRKIIEKYSLNSSFPAIFSNSRHNDVKSRFLKSP